MKLTILRGYAEGYYSGQEYNEDIVIRTETYEKIGVDLNGVNFYVSDLDGKHSEVQGEIEVANIREGDNSNSLALSAMATDGDQMCYILEEKFLENGLDLENEINIVHEYAKTLEKFVEVSFFIPESKAKKLNEFYESL